MNLVLYRLFQRDIMYMAGFFVIGLTLFFKGFIHLKKQKLVESAPVSTVRGLALGLVELTGEARGSTVLKSPVTGKDCVFYRYEVRREGSPDFEVISERQSDDFPFWIDDGTGIIMVVPKGAELIMEPVYKFETKEFRRLPDTVAAFLKKYDIEYKGMNRLYRFFIREWIIQPDQSVYVMGTAKKIDEPGLYLDRSFRPASASGDGGDVTDVIIGKGDPWQTFIISDRNQSQLQSDLSDWAGWSIIGGAAAVIVTFVYLVFRIRGILAGGF